MSEKPENTIEVASAHTQKNLKYGIICFCITTLVQLIISALYMHNSYIDRKEQAKQSQQNHIEQAKQSQLNRQFEILKMKYASQDTKYREIQYPIINVRDNLEDIYEICSQPLNPDQLKKLEIKKSELKKNRVTLLQAIGSIRVMFSPEVYSLFSNFTGNVEKVVAAGKKQNCPNYLPPPSYWLKQFRDIKGNMSKEITHTQQEIDKNLSAGAIKKN